MNKETQEKLIEAHQKRIAIGKQVYLDPLEIESYKKQAETEFPIEISEGMNTPEFKARFISDYYKFLERAALGVNPESMRGWAQYVTRGFTQHTYEKYSQEAYEQQNLKAYLFWFDAAEGAGALLNSLSVARVEDDVLKNEEYSSSILTSQKVFNQSLSMVDQIETFKSLQNRRGRLRDLLSDDPSGISVIEYSLEEIKEGKDVFIPDFVYVGALAAKTGFRKGYELLSEIS